MPTISWIAKKKQNKTSTLSQRKGRAPQTIHRVGGGVASQGGSASRGGGGPQRQRRNANYIFQDVWCDLPWTPENTCPHEQCHKPDMQQPPPFPSTEMAERCSSCFFCLHWGTIKLTCASCQKRAMFWRWITSFFRFWDIHTTEQEKVWPQELLHSLWSKIVNTFKVSDLSPSTESFVWLPYPTDNQPMPLRDCVCSPLSGCMLEAEKPLKSSNWIVPGTDSRWEQLSLKLHH